MLNHNGSRQEQILTLLLGNKTGLSIDQIAESFGISRNAVKQHMSVLEKDQLIAAAHWNATKGRPVRQYILTDQGINHFSKQYSWFCNLVLSELKQEMGSDQFTAFIQRMGRKIADSLAPQFSGKTAAEKAEILVSIMQDLGYQVSVEQSGGQAIISAINCVFHDLAMEHTELCEFDRTLIRSLLDNPVEQIECMAKQGCACRFKTTI